MGPAVESARIKAEMNAFVRTKEQLENAILVNENSRNAREGSQIVHQSDDPSLIGESGSRDAFQTELPRDLQQWKAGAGFAILEPSSTDSSEASRGENRDYIFSGDGRDQTGLGVSPSSFDRFGQSDVTGKSNLPGQQKEKPIGPPPYKAATKGSWGIFSAFRTSKVHDGMPAGSGAGARVPAGPSGQVSGSESEKGGNLLSNWLVKQKAASRLAKVTAREEAPAKSKHITKLVEHAGHSCADASSVLLMLSKRPILSDKFVALKGLLLVHQLMQRGSPDALPACYSQLSMLQDICKMYGRSAAAGGAGDNYQALTCLYSCMLADKIKFHKRFSAYEGNYSVDFKGQWDRSHTRKDGDDGGDSLSLEALSGLESILDRSLQCIAACMLLLRKKGTPVASSAAKQGTATAGANAGQKESDPDGLLVSIAVPVLVEAELLHAACCHLLDLLSLGSSRLHVPSKGLTAAKEQLTRQHRSLRSIFDEARSDPTLMSKNVMPPVIPAEPPCLAPPPLIATDSVPRDWLWPDEAASQPHLERKQSPEEAQMRGQQLDLSGISDSPRGRSREGSVEGLDRDLHVNTKKQVIGGVGAAMEAALQRHNAGLEGQGRHRRGTGESGSPWGSLDFDNMGGSGKSSRTGSPHTLAQHSPGTQGNPGGQVSPFHVSPLGVSPGQGMEPPPIAMGHVQNGDGLGHPLGWGHAATPSPGMSPRLGRVPQPPPPPHPILVHQQLQQMHLHNLQMQEEGKRYLRQQQEQHQLQQQMEWQQMQAQQHAAAVLEQAQFADLLANSPYKPEVFRAGTPLNQVVQMPPPPAAPGAHLPPLNPAVAQFLPPPVAAGRDPLGQEGRGGTWEQQPHGGGGGRQAGPGAVGGGQPAAVKQEALHSWHMGSMSDTSAWQTSGEIQAVAARERRESTAASLPEWEIPYAELKLGVKIGQGAFGDVVKGTWQGTEVAVKRLQNMAAALYAQASSDFRREVELVMKLRHPNVVLFMGACTAGEQGELCIVMEYAKNGSLYHVLRDPLLQMDMALVVRWGLEAARGMNYLHTRSPPIVHRDLKSVNLLVDADMHLKVSDFGLARTKASSYAHSQVGTWGWMAPEVLDKQPYDEKADVYSFGVVLWELITRDEPFKGLHPMQIIRAVDKGERPPLPDTCPAPYRLLITDCWQTDSHRRPRFDQIIDRLVAMELAIQQQAGIQVQTYQVR